MLLQRRQRGGAGLYDGVQCGVGEDAEGRLVLGGGQREAGVAEPSEAGDVAEPRPAAGEAGKTRGGEGEGFKRLASTLNALAAKTQE